MTTELKGIGRIEVETLPLPQHITETIHPIYTASGKVLFAYHTPGHTPEENCFTIVVINDDGTDLRTVFEGAVALHKSGNGFRMMPFADNKRVLLGDQILEASPNLDDAQSAQLVTVEYPAQLMNDPQTTHHWSEIVIAPDNEHMAWTSLQGFSGAVNYLGVLRREADKYTLDKVQVISSTKGLVPDEANPGYLLPRPLRGGEIKQFVRGGTGLSVAGSGGASLPDSVVQDFCSDAVIPITRVPGYDETTILSPDEKLGITMTTRFSPKNNFAILGLLPRPHGGLVTMTMTMNIYLYGVTQVRLFRKGNVGPALIEVDKSQNQPGYLGAQLSDPEENWVYYSPMSWHPNGKSALWPEQLRGSEKGRIQIARLPDYQPAPPVPARATPDNPPYGVPLEKATPPAPPSDVSGKIAGKNAGYIEYTSRPGNPMAGVPGFTKAEYVGFSDDGETFYNGFETSSSVPGTGISYEAKLKAEGKAPGEMDFRLAFTPFTGWSKDGMPLLRFEPAEDGRPMSTGFASFGGTTLRVEDMAE